WPRGGPAAEPIVHHRSRPRGTGRAAHLQILAYSPRSFRPLSAGRSEGPKSTQASSADRGRRSLYERARNAQGRRGPPVRYRHEIDLHDHGVLGAAHRPEPLRELAMNLRWTWRRQTVDLFRSLDAEAFVASGENPLAMLPRVPASRLAEAARDQSFLARMRGEVGDLRTYLDSGRWFQRTVPAEGSDISCTIAYFSMEFGITPTLPIYSGGLG